MNSRTDNIEGMFKEGAERLGLDLDDEVISKMELYVEELHRWSRKINLVGKKQSIPQLVEHHFLDSLVLLPFLQESETLVDIGSGAGFPGLVCKSALPGLHVHLVEPRLKRVSFLRHIIRLLKLDKAEVHAARLEECDRNALSARYITSRAVAPVGELLALVEGFAGDESVLLLMKGPKWRQELDEAAEVLEKTSFRCLQVDEFSLPFSGGKRAVLHFSRTGSR